MIFYNAKSKYVFVAVFYSVKLTDLDLLQGTVVAVFVGMATDDEGEYACTSEGVQSAAVDVYVGELLELGVVMLYPRYRTLSLIQGARAHLLFIRE